VSVGVFALIASVAESALHVWLDPLMNPDGVIYLLAAQAWLDNGYAAAAAAFPIPTYSILIGEVHQLSGLSLLASAQCLNAMLVALLVVGLQRLTWRLGGSYRAQLVVVVLGLLLPELNGFRSFLLRDFGSWTCSMWALAALVGYSRTPSPGAAIAFVVLAVSAATFRMEAVPLLLVLPLALFLMPTRRRAASMLSTPIVLLSALAVATFAATDTLPAGAWQLARDLLSGLPAHLQQQVAAFGTNVLDAEFHDYAGYGLAGGLLAMLLVHTVMAASPPLAAVAGVGLLRGQLGTLQRQSAPLLWGALLLTLAGMACVAISRGIIQTRYAMPAGLLATVVAAFTIDHWVTHAQSRRERSRVRSVLALLLLYLVAEGGFALWNSKHYYVEAAAWLAAHTDPDTRIFSRDVRLIYLANRRVDSNTLNPETAATATPQSLPQYEYWVVQQRAGATTRADLSPAVWPCVAEFANRKGDRLRIFKRP
jgi:hypothetical protein